MQVGDDYTVPNGSYLVVYRSRAFAGFGTVTTITYQMPGQPDQVSIQSQDEFEYLSATNTIPATVGLNPFTIKLPSGTIIRMRTQGVIANSGSYNFIGQLFSNTP